MRLDALNCMAGLQLYRAVGRYESAPPSPGWNRGGGGGSKVFRRFCFPSYQNLEGAGSRDRHPCFPRVPTALMMMYCKSREIMTASIGIISHLRFLCHRFLFLSFLSEKKSRHTYVKDARKNNQGQIMTKN